MNSEEEFYYSNSTTSRPVNVSKLQHIAGVGSSPIVHYSGSGAYFLDKIGDGIWRLEVMPDAISILDPFERASPKKEVTHIERKRNAMRIILPDLQPGIIIKGLNPETDNIISTFAGEFEIEPGVYLLSEGTKKKSTLPKSIGSIGVSEFVSPPISSASLYARHDPYTEVSAGKSFTISATIVGIDTGRVSVQIGKFGGGGPGGQRILPMVRKSSSEFTVEVPERLVTPGLLIYRIILQKGNDYAIFPENIKANPFAWDNYTYKTYSTYVAADNGKIEIFNPTTDRTARTYPVFRRGFQTGYTTGSEPVQLILRLSASELSGDHTIGLQWSFKDKIKGRKTELDSMNKLIIKARTGEKQPVRAKVTLTNKDAQSYSTFINLTNSFQEIEVPLSNLVADSALLLPRPYPGFQPLRFKGDGKREFRFSEAEKIEITIGSDLGPSDLNKPYSLELGSIWLQK
jgi:hypothetical protein